MARYFSWLYTRRKSFCAWDAITASHFDYAASLSSLNTYDSEQAYCIAVYLHSLLPNTFIRSHYCYAFNDLRPQRSCIGFSVGIN